MAVHYIHNAKAPDSTILLSFPFKCNGHALFDMQNNFSCSVPPKYAENTAIAYALFEHVKQLCTGSPVAVKSTQIGAMWCFADSTSFTIGWKTGVTRTLIGKTLKWVVKYLSAHALLKRYSDNLRILGAKPIKNVFAHVGADLNTAFSGISVAIISKVRIADADISNWKAAIKDKLDPQAPRVNERAASPPSHPESKHEMVILETKGIATYLVFMYLDKYKIPVIPHGNQLEVRARPSAIQALRAKDKIKSFVDPWGKRFGAELGKFLATAVAASRLASANTVVAAQSMTAAKMADAIQSALE